MCKDRNDCPLAVYAGSFDPITLGHIDIVKRASKIFKEVVVAIANSPSKHNLLFSAQERKELAIKALDGIVSNVRVEIFDELLVNFMKRIEATVIVRGLRAVSDYEYEAQIAMTNRKLDADIETVFLLTSREYAFISSSMVKEIAVYHGKLSEFVPQNVEAKLIEKFDEK